MCAPNKGVNVGGGRMVAEEKTQNTWKTATNRRMTEHMRRVHSGKQTHRVRQGS